MVVIALLMTVESMAHFTAGALGMAAAIGVGDSTVFKLVPEYFRTRWEQSRGLVGDMG